MTGLWVDKSGGSQPPGAGMTWAEAVAAYVEYLAAGGSSIESRRVRRAHLNGLQGSCPGVGPWEVTYSHLITHMARPGWKPETRKSVRQTIRGFYGWAVDTDLTTCNPALKLPGVKIPATVPKPTPGDVFDAALAAADARGRLMLLLGARSGLRRAEIATLHADDVLLPNALRITGKGGRTRHIPLDEQFARELHDVAQGGWVFPGQIDGHISPGHVGVVLKRLLGAGYTGHTLRHMFASRAYAGTRDLLAVQTLLGHSKPETTARYTAVPDGALLAAVMAAAG
jgi:integrase/recombinase XerC